MAPWLQHPKYVPVRDRLIGYLRSARYRFRRLRPVIFLCGAAYSPPRDTLREYLSKHDLSIFYAEEVWAHIAARTDRSALAMEADLAALADMLIILVESPGTFAELGAFALSDALRPKLLPLVDRKYQGQTSFIATGPLRWIDAESRFAPTIYAPLEQILIVIDTVEERIARIAKPHPARVEDLAAAPKHLLFFISDLVAVIYPATFEAVEYYLGNIAPSILSSGIDVPTFMGLAVAMGLLARMEIPVNGAAMPFFVPAGPDPLRHPYHHRRMLDLPSQRADQIAVLETIPVARDVLHLASGMSGTP